MPEGFGPITDYDELVRSVLDTLGRPTLEDAVPQWIAATELELFRDCNVRPGDQTATGTMTGGETSISLPYGFQDLKLLEFNGTAGRFVPRIVSLDQFARYLDETDVSPTVMAIFGDSITFAPAAKAGQTYRMLYVGLPTPISRTNKTNRLLEMGWDAYLYGALTLSAPYMLNDERLPMWSSLYAQKKASLKLAVWRSRTGGGPLATRPDFMVNDQHIEEGRY